MTVACETTLPPDGFIGKLSRIQRLQPTNMRFITCNVFARSAEERGAGVQIFKGLSGPPAQSERLNLTIKVSSVYL